MPRYSFSRILKNVSPFVFSVLDNFDRLNANWSLSAVYSLLQPVTICAPYFSQLYLAVRVGSGRIERRPPPLVGRRRRLHFRVGARAIDHRCHSHAARRDGRYVLDQADISSENDST
jgi:hypothetical protein